MKQVSHLSLGPHYTVQKKAWMDETVMHDWIDSILKPYMAEAPEGIVPILFLDSYHAHMMSMVFTHIQVLGVVFFSYPSRRLH